MTVQTEVSRSGPYAGAGTTGPFTVGFRFLADTHLRVIKTDSAGVDTDLALGTDFTVSGAGGTSGTVTTGVAIAVGESITIIRNVPFTQEADYVDNDAFPAESHEAALDLLTMQTQQIKEAQDRALALSPTVDISDVSTELPPPIANNIIGWNSAADGFINYDPGGLAGIVSFGTFQAETFDGDGATVDFVLTTDALVASNCDVSVGGVTQTPDIDFIYVAGSKTVRFLTGAPPAGTDNVFVRYGSVLDVGSASAIDGQTAIGTALIKAADEAAARTAIGAVGMTGAETVSGIKTFASSPNVPTLTAGDSSTKVANAAFVAAAAAAAVASAAPAGTVISFAGSTAPTGYLECDGTAVSRATYAALFAAISTVYGAGNGTTTFNLPDLRGEFIRGYDHGRNVDTGRTLGSAQIGTVVTFDKSGTVGIQAARAASAAGDGANQFGADLLPALSDYPNVNEAGATATSAALSTNSVVGVSRPRNVALMYCIKT